MEMWVGSGVEKLKSSKSFDFHLADSRKTTIFAVAKVRGVAQPG